MLVLAFATWREMCAAVPGAPQGLAPGNPVPVDLGGRQVLVLVTGIGPLCAALRLGRLLGAGEVSGVVNLGVGGSFDTNALPLGSVAVANLEIWPEYGLRTEAGVDASTFDFPLLSTPAGPVRQSIALDPDKAAHALGLTLPALWPRVTSLTVAGVSADEATAKAHHRHHGAALENMEGFALALACLDAGLPFLEVRSVSNAVGTRDKSGWNLPDALSALNPVSTALFGQSP